MCSKRLQVGARAVRGWLFLMAWCASCGPSEAPGAGAKAAQASASANLPLPVAMRESPPSPAPQAAPSSPAPQAAPVRPAPQAEPVAVAPQAEPVAPKSPPIPLGELLVRRDLWPAKVALTRPLTIERGVTLPAGHELCVYEFNGSDIVLDTGDDIFDCPADATDVIERASALRARLSPEQLALTDNTLPKRPELWPLRVNVTRRLQFQNGKQIPVGREVSLRSVSIGWVSLYDRELGDHFQAEVFETDVLARARERLTLPEAQREPYFVRALAATLEPSPTARDPELAHTDYVLVYRARLGCPRCAAFAPELARFYERVQREHPAFETVFYSEDKTAADAATVFAREKFPGRALRFDQRLAAADLASQSGELLPLVYLYDRSGALITRNGSNGGKPSATDVLAVLEAKLAEAR